MLRTSRAVASSSQRSWRASPAARPGSAGPTGLPKPGGQLAAEDPILGAQVLDLGGERISVTSGEHPPPTLSAGLRQVEPKHALPWRRSNSHL